MLRRSLITGALGVCLALATQAQTGKPVRVGLIAPLTGGSADFGNSVRYGAELAVKEINEVGGFLGRPLELVIRDDKAVPDEGRRVSEDLVLKEKVDFTIGFCNTGVAMRSLDVFQDNKHLLMVPCSQGTAVTTKYPPAQSYIFRVAPPDILNARFLVSEIVDRRKLRRVAILADRTGYGEGGVKDISDELAKRNLQPVYVGRFDLGVKTLVEEMRAAQSYDAVYLMLRALFQTKGDVSGDALKKALENFDRPHRGVVTTYGEPFSATDHDAFSVNMIWLGVWRRGEIQFYYPEDAKRSAFIRRKEP